jgi:hypothetical protein
VLLLDTHPMAPTALAIRQALDRLGAVSNEPACA